MPVVFLALIGTEYAAAERGPVLTVAPIDTERPIEAASGPPGHTLPRPHDDVHGTGPAGSMCGVLECVREIQHLILRQLASD
jgi:hypothetical protein